METLLLFNQQVLQCQDDAYTLAWYLLGDETQAEEVMQSAVEAAYSCFASGKPDCRRLILSFVVEQCRRRKPPARVPDGTAVHHRLRALPEPERAVLVLIDVLGLAYREAACIIGRPLNDIGRLLARARRKIKDQAN